MKTIKELYRIGIGPSSSHTMGPKFAAERFLAAHPDAPYFRVTLYESLGATGKGHLTDQAILQVLGTERTEILWCPDLSLPLHPNAMLFEALDADKKPIAEERMYSLGGGAIRSEHEADAESAGIYPLKDLASIMAHCEKNGITYWEYVEQHEEEDLWAFLSTIWHTMQGSIERGLTTQGVLPGSIGLRRHAWAYLRKTKMASEAMQQTGLLTSYAFAVAEENASGGTIVTAPTCGACGIVPAVLQYLKETHALSEKEILHALATAALFGNVIKYNGSISGAEVGCQGEVGSACAMASAAATQLLGGSLRQIEYAAEMGLEHHLGLTCDPVDGLVQIPCIERNACAANRAVSHAHMAILSDGSHRIFFDEVVAVMKQTGHDLPSLYRETSTGGLAKAYAGRKTQNRGCTGCSC